MSLMTQKVGGVTPVIFFSTQKPWTLSLRTLCFAMNASIQGRSCKNPWLTFLSRKSQQQKLIPKNGGQTQKIQALYPVAL